MSPSLPPPHTLPHTQHNNKHTRENSENEIQRPDCRRATRGGACVRTSQRRNDLHIQPSPLTNPVNPYHSSQPPSFTHQSPLQNLSPYRSATQPPYERCQPLSLNHQTPETTVNRYRSVTGPSKKPYTCHGTTTTPCKNLSIAIVQTTRPTQRTLNPCRSATSRERNTPRRRRCSAP
jgi:hypothetical protein